MPKRKKQHFVPRFYLKLFSNNNKSIGIYNIKRRKYIPSGSIKNQAYLDYFYGKDGNIEELLALIENEASQLLSKICAERWLPEYGSDEHFNLLTFVLFLHSRTEYIGTQMNEMIDKLSKRILIEQPEFKSEIDNFEIKLNKAANFVLGVVALMVPLGKDLKYKLLLNKTTDFFVTSDHPVVKYNQFLESKEAPWGITGLQSKGLQIFLPIKPELILLLYDSNIYKVGNKKRKVVRIDKRDDVKSLNILQFINAHNNIYFNNQVREEYISELNKESEKYQRESKTNVKKYYSTRGKDFLLHIYDEDIRMNFELSIITFTKLAKKYKLGNRVEHIRKPELTKKYINLIRKQDGKWS